MGTKREGLLCPECPTHPTFRTIEDLQTHFSREHLNEGRDEGVLGMLASLVFTSTDTAPPPEQEPDDSQVTRQHWKLDSKHCYACGIAFTALNRRHHCRCCGQAFCNSHWGFTVRLDTAGQPVPEGVPCRGCRDCLEVWEDMMGDNMGVVCRLTDRFKARSKKRASQLEIDTNRLYGRLQKMAGALVAADTKGLLGEGAKARTEAAAIEQQVVPWQDASKASACTVCQRQLRLFSRLHHCRLCGRVVCDYGCSEMLPLSYLNQVGQLLGAGSGQGALGGLWGYQLRTCTSCRHLMKRREVLAARGLDKSVVAQLYQKLIEQREAVESLMPETTELIARRKVTAEDVRRAKELKGDLKKMLEVCDLISQKIVGLPLPDGVVPNMKNPRQPTTHPQSQAVQINIRRSAVQYMQERMVKLQALPLQPSPPSPKAQKKVSKTNTAPAQKQIKFPKMSESQRAEAIAIHVDQRDYVVRTLREARRKGNQEEIMSLEAALMDLNSALESLGVDLRR
eukprot:comp20633_c0_seq1/m.26706 comp20633_c0_seq1/g.26706  ORF comp20633_c0_seq1/g.26706 comp20633_c0_seq1/m.26706 type:complete len:510 (-) comp20633_c0_seq1:521-2050(-)